jgi:hypothetical protein
MKKQILPWLILACALGLSGTAAYYSIIGLSLLFSSIAIPVIIMASFLEVSKIIIASLLHSYWKGLNVILRGYLTVSLIVLSLITSLGIYGLLSALPYLLNTPKILLPIYLLGLIFGINMCRQSLMSGREKS